MTLTFDNESGFFWTACKQHKESVVSARRDGIYQIADHCSCGETQMYVSHCLLPPD